MGIPKHSAALLPLIQMPPKLYSYVVARDYGFAPNPFYGFCTLATCKPEIRKLCNFPKGVHIDDWVVGTGSKGKGRARHIVYTMRVTEAITFNEYWYDPRFRDKRPNLNASLKKAYGDNIYHRDEQTGEWRQMDSHHSLEHGIQNVNNIQRDTRADRVLISDDFIYWGGSGPETPLFRDIDICHTTQGYKCNFPAAVVADFINWISDFDERGYCGDPLDWK